VEALVVVELVVAAAEGVDVGEEKVENGAVPGRLE
jgi:hypothetical protein